MRKPQSKTKTSLLKTKKEENQYADFLQKKLEQQQYLTHLVNIDVKTLQEQNAQLKQLIAKLRAGDKRSNKQITQLQKDKEKLQNAITKLQEQNNFLSKKVERIQSEYQKQFSNSEPIETKLVFKQFLTTSFPTYKDTIKRILRFFMYIEKFEQNGKQERIKVYNDFVKSIVQKIMLFIFPKKTQNQKSNSIAETMVARWRDNQTAVQKQLRKQLASLKILNSQYLEKIQSYEAELIRLRAGKNMLDSKVQNYQKTLKVKVSEFVIHLKKALIKKTEYGEQDEAIEHMKQIMHTFQSIVSASGQHPKNTSDEKKVANNQPYQQFMLSNKSLPNKQMSPQALQTTQNQFSKKALRKHPILKKNIYGYYEEPQLSTQWNFLTNTKHPDLNKYTQTLPDDLTILITHPVIVVHLLDGDIRPKRTRHNTEFYVKIHKNSQSLISSQSVNSPDYKPVWNRQYIIKNYDLPSLRVQLLNKSKGLRDKILGEGKLSVESSESKIVPIRKQKEYEGRVRFGLHYPKGNIFQFVINSIQLVVPQSIKILAQTVQITANMNDSIVEKFSNANLVKYLTNKSIFIIQGVDGDIEGRIINRKVFGTVSFNQFTQKQGQKKVTIKAEDWQIILEGYIVLIVSEQNEPKRIKSSQEETGSMDVQLQPIHDQQSPVENNNEQITRLNILRKKLNTFNKSLLSWLEFRVKRATLYKDIEIFSKMDPYYIAELAQCAQNHQPIRYSFKSSVQQNIGIHPVWEDDRYFFSLAPNRSIYEVTIKFMDEQVIKDRLLGYSKIESLMSSIRQGALQREIGIFRQESSPTEQVGTAIVSYSIICSYIIFIAVQSLRSDGKQLMIGAIQQKQLMIGAIQQKGRQSLKIPLKLQQLFVMKPYPVSQRTFSICISCGSQSKCIPLEQLLASSTAQGQLYLPQHSVALKYMFFQ